GHHVATEPDATDGAPGLADTHQVARPARRQPRGHFGGHLARQRRRFADGEPADTVTGEVEFDQLLSALAAQVGVPASLDDTEQHLLRGIAVLSEIFARAARPVERARRRMPRAVVACGIFDALV